MSRMPTVPFHNTLINFINKTAGTGEKGSFSVSYFLFLQTTSRSLHLWTFSYHIGFVSIQIFSALPVCSLVISKHPNIACVGPYPILLPSFCAMFCLSTIEGLLVYCRSDCHYSFRVRVYLVWTIPELYELSGYRLSFASFSFRGLIFALLFLLVSESFTMNSCSSPLSLFMLFVTVRCSLTFSIYCSTESWLFPD